MKNFIRSFLIFISIIAQLQFAIAQTASILPQAETQFLDNNGKPVTSGTVDFYIPGSTTRKTTWQDADRTIANANPVVLNGSGRAIVYGYGGYRQVLKDRDGNLIWDRVTNSYSIPNGQVTTGDGNSVGTILQWSSLIAPNQYVFAYGQEISRVTYSTFLTAVTLTQSVNCSSGSNVLSGITDTSQTPVGASIEVSCVSGTVTVNSKTSNSYTVSSNAIATTTVNATVFPYGNGNGSTTFNVPDLRGRVLAGRDNMGGIAASRLTSTYFANASAVGATGGLQSHTLTAAEAAVLTYTTTFTPNPPTITFKENNLDLAGGSGVFRKYILDPTSGDGSPTVYSGATETLVTTSNAGGGAHAIVQPTITINYIVKVTPDLTGLTASGVQSIQGMSGVLTCGNSLTCASQVLGVNPTGLSPIFDSAFSSTQGSILYRNASGWVALAPGPSGFVLSSQGAGDNPVWIANSNPSTNQSANTVLAGPTSGGAAPPAYRALVGADLPVPAASTLGGVKSSTAPTDQFATGVDTSGNVTYALPPSAGIVPLTRGGMGASQAAATANQIPVYPGSGGSAVPTTLFSLLNAVCSTALTRPACISFMDRADVTWFGAACDSATNDLTAIQAAIDYMDATYTGGIVSIPLGRVCIINGPLALKSGVVLWSPARFESEISVGSNDVAAIITTNTCQYCGIRNIFIVGSQSASASQPTVLVASGRPFLAVDSNIWGGAIALKTAGVDGLLFNVNLRAANTAGVGVSSSGANWYIRVILDNSVTGFAAFQQTARDAGLSGVMENSFTDCDFSGPYTHSVYIDDAGGASAITKFSGGSVFSQRVDIINAVATMFSTVEFGSTVLTSGAPLSIVGSYAFNPTTVTGAGGRSCSGNLGITC